METDNKQRIKIKQTNERKEDRDKLHLVTK